MLDELASVSHEVNMRLRIMRTIDRSLDDISVREICERAGISRWTFYHYFDSKYDIPVWHGILVQQFYVDKIGRTLDWETGYQNNFRLLSEEKDFYANCMRYTANNSDGLNLMEEHRKSVIFETLSDYRHVEVDDDLRFCVEAFVHNETYMVARWMRDGCEPDYQLFAKRMVEAVPTRLFELMGGEQTGDAPESDASRTGN